MATALDIAKGALALCGGSDLGNAPDAPIGADLLRLFNAMRAQWNAEGVPCQGLRTLAATVDGGPIYTFGTGGDNATRPLGVRQVTVDDGTTTYAPTPLSWDEYQQASDRTLTGSPEWYAVNPAFPQIEVALWPAPTTGTVRVLAETAFAQIANLSDTVPEPDEYLLAFEYNLAILFAPRIAANLSEAVYATAGRAYEALAARANPQPPPRFKGDPFLTARRDPWNNEIEGE